MKFWQIFFLFFCFGAASAHARVEEPRDGEEEGIIDVAYTTATRSPEEKKDDAIAPPISDGVGHTTTEQKLNERPASGDTADDAGELPLTYSGGIALDPADASVRRPESAAELAVSLPENRSSDASSWWEKLTNTVQGWFSHEQSPGGV